MSLHLSLSTQLADTDDGSVEFVVTLENTGDEEVTFTTPSGALFRLQAEDDDGNPVHGLGMLHSQAYTRWTIDAGGSIEREINWTSLEVWEALSDELGRENDADDMWEDVPEDYDELTVTVTTCAVDGPVADLSVTERVDIP